jgi:hypothetical protein
MPAERAAAWENKVFATLVQLGDQARRLGPEGL